MSNHSLAKINLELAFTEGVTPLPGDRIKGLNHDASYWMMGVNLEAPSTWMTSTVQMAEIRNDSWQATNPGKSQPGNLKQALSAF